MMVIVGLFAAVRWMTRPADLSPLLLQPAQANTLTADPCLNKQRCVIVNIAPWCPACASTLPLIRVLRDAWMNSPRYGFKIIVSADRLDALQDEARSIGDNTYVDPENRFVKMTHFNAFPTWVVLDENKKMLRHFAGGTAESDDAARYGLLAQLGITS